MSSTNKRCKNCQQELNGKFCSNCGQDSNTHRMSMHFIWHGFLHFDNGIFYTIKQLLFRPGYAIKDYINGK